jgi:hypothetical protein
MCNMRPDCGKNGPKCDFVPDEVKARMETVRKNRDQLRDLWVKAVTTRGDKTIVQVKEEFLKTNAALIADTKKLDQSVRDDMKAIREGFDEKACDMPNEGMGQKMNGPNHCMMPGAGPLSNDENGIKDTLDAEIVIQINALKAPLTAETFAKIRQDVMAKHREEFEKNFSNETMDRPNMPEMMPPPLARMRDAMCQMRGAPLGDRQQLRTQIREAMKIQDQAKREAAIKKILDDMEPEGQSAENAGHNPPAKDSTNK